MSVTFLLSSSIQIIHVINYDALNLVMYVKTILSCLAVMFQIIIATIISTQLQENRILSDFHCYKPSACHRELDNYLLSDWNKVI